MPVRRSAKKQRKPKRRAHGEGSLFQRERRGRIEWVKQLAGGGKQFVGKTAREAIRRHDEYLLRQGRIGSARSADSLAVYLTSWLKLSAQNVSARTLEGYETIVRLHLIPHLGAIPLSRLKSQHIEQMLLDMKEMSSHLRHKAFTTLNRALKRAHKLKLIASNPCDDADAPPRPRAKARAMSDEDIARFLAVIKGDRLEAYWITLLGTGLRRGEALALRVSDITLWTEKQAGKKTTQGELHVQQTMQRVRPVALDSPRDRRASGRLEFGTPKTDAGARTIRLPSVVAEAIRRHLVRQKEQRLVAGEAWRNVHNLVFTTSIGTPLEPRAMTRRYQQLCAKAGIKTHYKLHATRHTAASMLIAAGEDVETVRRILGHTLASTTLTIYTHERSTDERAAVRQDEALRKIATKQARKD